jgi:hypothetical protein
LIAALFFLAVGYAPVYDISNDAVRFMDSGELQELQFRPQQNSMGFNPFCGDILLCEGVTVQTTSSENWVLATTGETLLDLAVVFANITTDAHMIAVANNSLLNAKYSVYVLAQQNITTNGVRLGTGQMHIYDAPFPNSLTISNGNLTFTVRLRQVASLDDIEDSDRPTNYTAKYNELDLISISIAGIPAVLTSLGLNIAILVLWKSQQVQEGLPNEL